MIGFKLFIENTDKWTMEEMLDEFSHVWERKWRGLDINDDLQEWIKKYIDKNESHRNVSLESAIEKFLSDDTKYLQVSLKSPITVINNYNQKVELKPPDELGISRLDLWYYAQPTFSYDTGHIIDELKKNKHMFTDDEFKKFAGEHFDVSHFSQSLSKYIEMRTTKAQKDLNKIKKSVAYWVQEIDEMADVRPNLSEKSRQYSDWLAYLYKLDLNKELFKFLDRIQPKKESNNSNMIHKFIKSTLATLEATGDL